MFDPVDEQGGSGGVASEGADGGHLALAPGGASEQEDGGGGIAWGKDAGVVDTECGVQRDGLERGVFFGQPESELHVGVSASATDMAMGAVGVEVGPGTVVKRSGEICGVGEHFRGDGWFGEQDAVDRRWALHRGWGNAGEALSEDRVAWFILGKFRFPGGDVCE